MLRPGAITNAITARVTLLAVTGLATFLGTVLLAQEVSFDGADLLERLGARYELGASTATLDLYDRQFRSIDRDGDGRHSQVEYIENGAYLTAQARRGIFMAADADRDGTVSRAEYILNRLITDEAKALLQRMDDNEDGFIQRGEFVRHGGARLAHPALAERVFDAWDADGDRELMVPEYLRVWGRWARKGRGTAEQRRVAWEEAAKPVRKQARVLQGAVHPRLSPDGDHIVCSYQGAIWRLPVGGGVMDAFDACPGNGLPPGLRARWRGDCLSSRERFAARLLDAHPHPRWRGVAVVEGPPSSRTPAFRSCGRSVVR